MLQYQRLFKNLGINSAILGSNPGIGGSSGTSIDSPLTNMGTCSFAASSSRLVYAFVGCVFGRFVDFSGVQCTGCFLGLGVDGEER